VRYVEIGEIGDEEKVTCIDGRTERQGARIPEAKDEFGKMPRALKEKSLLP
jgi:hypothetical protein